MAKGDTVKTVKKPSEIYVFTRTGEVRGVQRWSDTHVSSSGGGGYVGPQGGHVSAAQVHSSVVQRGKFFLCEDNGSETEIESLFSVREGQRIVAAWGGDNQTKRGYLMGLHNIATGQREIMDREVRRLNASFGCLALGIALGIAAIVGATFAGTTLFDMLAGSSHDAGLGYFVAGGALMGIAPFAYFLSRSNRRGSWITNAVKSALNAAIDNALAKETGGSANAMAPIDDTPPANGPSAIIAAVVAAAGAVLIFMGISSANQPSPDNLVPFSALEEYMPATIDGVAHTGVREFRTGGIAATFCPAQGCYDLLIADGGIAAKNFRAETYNGKQGCSYEKLRPVDGRRSQERYDCNSKLLEYTETFGYRMLVGANSRDVPIATLKNAVRKIDGEAVLKVSQDYRLE